MKQLKKFLSLILSIAILFAVGMQPVLASNVYKETVETEASVQPVGYRQVAMKMAVAESETVVKQNTGDIHYYWGENYFVVQDENGYYFVEIDDGFSYFIVNGKTFSIEESKSAASIAAKAVTSNSKNWSTAYDINTTFDVGGLPHSVVGGLIGGAIGTLVPGPVLSTVIGAVLGTLIGTFLTGVFPVDYKLTVQYLKRLRTLELALPTVIEFYERTAIYGGPNRNLYETTLHYSTRTYTEQYWH